MAIHNLAKIPGAVPKVVKGIRKITPILIGLGSAGSAGEAIDAVMETLNDAGEKIPNIEVTEHPGVSSVPTAPSVTRPSNIIAKGINGTAHGVGKVISYSIDGTIGSVIGGLKGFTNGLLLRSDIAVQTTDGSNIIFCIVKNATTGAVNIQSSPALAMVIKYIIFRTATSIVVLIFVTWVAKKGINYLINNFIYRDKVNDRIKIEKKPKKEVKPYDGDFL